MTDLFLIIGLILIFVGSVGHQHANYKLSHTVRPRDKRGRYAKVSTHVEDEKDAAKDVMWIRGPDRA